MAQVTNSIGSEDDDRRTVRADRPSLGPPQTALPAALRTLPDAIDSANHLHVRSACRTKRLSTPALSIGDTAVTSATRIATIVEGKADLACGSTTNSAQRRQQEAFTVPHWITGARHLVRGDSPIGELSDFAGKELASTKGSTPLKAIVAANQDRTRRISMLEAPQHAQAVEMVAREQAAEPADELLVAGLLEVSRRPGTELNAAT